MAVLLLIGFLSHKKGAFFLRQIEERILWHRKTLQK